SDERGRPLRRRRDCGHAGEERRFAGGSDAYQRGAPKEEYSWGGNPKGGRENSKESWPRLSCDVVSRQLNQALDPWEALKRTLLSTPLADQSRDSSSPVVPWSGAAPIEAQELRPLPLAWRVSTGRCLALSRERSQGSRSTARCSMRCSARASSACWRQHARRTKIPPPWTGDNPGSMEAQPTHSAPQKKEET
ncbi:unnamed protein product, partial [Ectocarpus sp. 12 AP-2014]